jgi:hypothetical protein
VTIRRVAWTAPHGVTVHRIVSSRGGTCTRERGGFQCTTQLAPPSCASCAGGDLSVRFEGTGPARIRVATSSGRYWKTPALQPGDVDLLASRADAQMSTRSSA